ncbi:MAG: PadR family transcriptional regulator [Acidobacteriota bacterium]
MTPSQKLTENLEQELRRGVLILAILRLLESEHYGYALRERLAERGLEVAEGTLYPLLRRLEAQGLLSSRWQIGETRPRRYYKTSAAGIETLRTMAGEWTAQVRVLEDILRGL